MKVEKVIKNHGSERKEGKKKKLRNRKRLKASNDGRYKLTHVTKPLTVTES